MFSPDPLRAPLPMDKAAEGLMLEVLSFYRRPDESGDAITARLNVILGTYAGRWISLRLPFHGSGAARTSAFFGALGCQEFDETNDWEVAEELSGVVVKADAVEAEKKRRGRGSDMMVLLSNYRPPTDMEWSELHARGWRANAVKLIPDPKGQHGKR